MNSPLDPSDLARVNELADRVLRLEDADDRARADTDARLSHEAAARQSEMRAIRDEIVSALDTFRGELKTFSDEQTAQRKALDDLTDNSARRRDILTLAATPIVVALLGVVGLYIGSH